MVIVSKELLLSSLFATIANLNDIARCNYWVAANDSLYGKASLRNTEGFIICLDEIQTFSVNENSIVLFVENGIITLTRNGVEVEED